MSSTPIHLHRSPLPIPITHQINNDKIAYFFHPAYPQPHDLLFTLPCVDPVSAGGDGGQAKGLHHHTALLACQIIANNAFDSGQLYFDRQGTRAVLDRVPTHGVLLPTEYFFIVNCDPTYQYPVVPSFRDWCFPHGRIPNDWPSPQLAPSTDTTRRCALTNHGFGLTNAHIVPKEEGEWFMLNGMSRYSVDMRDVNDSHNIIRLRADIHRCFDTRMFSIVPKPKFTPADSDTTAPIVDPAYVLHVFGANVGEFSSLYHNTPLQYLDNTSREFIFSRLAWTVLILIKPFVLAGTQRSVVRCRNKEGLGVEWKAEDVPGPKLSSLYGGGGSRSASPKKRSRQREEDCDSLADANEWFNETFDEDRGRKRVRRDLELGQIDGAYEAPNTPPLSNASTSFLTSNLDRTSSASRSAEDSKESPSARETGAEVKL